MAAISLVMPFLSLVKAFFFFCILTWWENTGEDNIVGCIAFNCLSFRMLAHRHCCDGLPGHLLNLDIVNVSSKTRAFLKNKFKKSAIVPAVNTLGHFNFFKKHCF